MPKSKVTTDKLCFLINSFSLNYVEGLQELRSRALEGDVTEVFRRSATAHPPCLWRCELGTRGRLAYDCARR